MSKVSLARAAILATTIFCPIPGSAAPQKTAADSIEKVRPAVVQVSVRITDAILPNTVSLSKPLQDCFSVIPSVCVVGTGFFINDTGDVVTASHVADTVQQIIQVLETNGIHAEATIGVNEPNVETKNLIMASGTIGFPVSLIAIDAEHDVAAFRPSVNPFTNMPQTFSGPGTSGLPEPNAAFVRLAVDRPRDGEEIFACGFPFGVPGLVTTSGAIASAWKSEILETAKAAGKTTAVGVFWVDLRVNPGNSGGPIFRMGDQSVLGMVVELKGSLGFVVPARYIAEFLQGHDIPSTPIAN
jgi:S1-C subfamily serine protease